MLGLLKRKRTTYVQQEADRDCVACVAAMLTGTSLARFKETVPMEYNHNGGYYTRNAAFDYITLCGYLVGSKTLLDKHTEILEKGVKGFVIVHNDFPDWNHAICWDGRRLWNPSRNVRKINKGINTYIAHLVYYVTESLGAA